MKFPLWDFMRHLTFFSHKNVYSYYRSCEPENNRSFHITVKTTSSSLGTNGATKHKMRGPFLLLPTLGAPPIQWTVLYHFGLIQ